MPAVLFCRKLFEFALTSSLRFLLAFHGGLLIMLSLTNLGQNAGFRAGALKPPEGAVQRFVIFDSDLCHFFIPSSRPTAGVAAELTG